MWPYSHVLPVCTCVGMTASSLEVPLQECEEEVTSVCRPSEINCLSSCNPLGTLTICNLCNQILLPEVFCTLQAM